MKICAILAGLVAAVSAEDTKMIHVQGFSPSPPSADQRVVDPATLDHSDVRCAKDNVIKNFVIGNVDDEQSVIDGCHKNSACLFVVRTATKMVQCKSFEESDLKKEIEDDFLALQDKCGTASGSKNQRIQRSPGVDMFLKIPSSTDMSCRGRDPSPCLSKWVQFASDSGIADSVFAQKGVQATQLLAADGQLSLLADTGHLDNMCFGNKEFGAFKNLILRGVKAQSGDERKARLGAVIVRLAGHDLMDADVNAGNGGPDGCVLWQGLQANSREHLDNDNKGIENAWSFLKPICGQFQFSRADCLATAAEVIITDTSKGGITFPHYVGRKDAKSCDFNRAGSHGMKSRLPAWFGGGGSLNTDANNLLRERLGLPWDLYVALLGVHNLGGISSKNTVIPQPALNGVTSARWKKNWKMAQAFDSGYFRGLLGEKWFECDQGGKVMLQCDTTVHGASGGKQFFAIWNHPKADHGPTALGPLANKGNHATKKQMIALSTDMAIASDIYNTKPGMEPCPGCSKADQRRAPRAAAPVDYRKGDPRRQATAATKTFAKSTKKFHAAFEKAWDLVTTNNHIKTNLKTLKDFPSCRAVSKPAAPSAKPASPSAKPASPKCKSRTLGTCSGPGDSRCSGASGKCINRRGQNKCLCHSSECNFNGRCVQDPSFTGNKRGGLSLNSLLAADGELETASSSGNSNSNIALIIGSGVCGSVATIFVIAGVAMILRQKKTITTTESSMSSL